MQLANSQDPLNQLRDIHLPEAISFWPPAIGWWVLLIILTAFIIWICRQFILKKKNRYYRKVALKKMQELNEHYVKTNDSQECTQAFNILIRQVALKSYSRDKIAHLTGDAWLTFLDKSCQKNYFSVGVGRVLNEAAYQPNTPINIEKLIEIGTYWIKHHS